MTDATPQETVNPLAASVIRTVVPVIAGLLLAWLANLGLHFDSPTIDGVLTAVFTAAYYVIARALEHFVSAKAGWLLGLPSAPAYPAKPATPQSPVDGPESHAAGG